jgi:hypothetical protein
MPLYFIPLQRIVRAVELPKNKCLELGNVIRAKQNNENRDPFQDFLTPLLQIETHSHYVQYACSFLIDPLPAFSASKKIKSTNDTHKE